MTLKATLGLAVLVAVAAVMVLSILGPVVAAGWV